MKEIHDILETWAQVERLGQEAVLATVVKVEGSAYRRPGARLLITADGHSVGSISGGCVERDLVKRRWWAMSAGTPTMRRYDTTAGDDTDLAFGLGCDGVVHVLIEPLRPAAATHLEFLARCRRERREGVIATIVRVEGPCGVRVGDRFFSSDRLDHGPIAAFVAETIPQVVAGRRNQTGVCKCALGKVEIFFEWVVPPIQLLVLGSGRDTPPVVRLAKDLGWRVVVIGTHVGQTKPERFPNADDVRLAAPEAILDVVSIDSRTAAVIMTHSYQTDLALVQMLAPMPLVYLGVLGSRQRTASLFEELAGVCHTVQGGTVFGRSLHTPVGLDIGAETPEEIALSIVAEIQATLAGREGSKLRDRQGPIHINAGEGRR